MQIGTFALWYWAMGMVDELHDTVKNVPAHNKAFPKWSFYTAYAALLLPIPYLISMHEVYAQYAVVQIVCHAIAKKLDNAIFKATVVIGLPLIAGVAYLTEASFGSWPVLGMISMVVGHFL